MGELYKQQAISCIASRENQAYSAILGTSTVLQVTALTDGPDVVEGLCTLQKKICIGQPSLV